MRYLNTFSFGMILAFTYLVSLPVKAADSTPVLAAADAQRVDKIAKKCTKCHGDHGISDDPEIPHLAGQKASYLFKQLQHFKAGERDGGRMNKTIKKLDEQQLADLAVNFAASQLPTQDGVTVPTKPGLVSSGDQARGIDACADCHGEDGRGKQDKYDAPALAGMPLDYFATSIEVFADGTRKSDVDEVMGKVAKALTDEEVQQLSLYYLAIGGRKPIPVD
jgi:cytochrome c553